MNIQKGYRFRLRKFRGNQEQTLAQWMGCARKVYNQALEWEKKYYKFTGLYPGRALMCKWLDSFKEQFPYLEDVNAQALQQVVGDLDYAFYRKFRGLGELPVFKKKYEHDAVRIPQNFEVDIENGRVYIPN